MGKRVLEDSDFISEFKKLGTAGMVKKYKMSERGVLMRRAKLQERYKQIINSPNVRGAQPRRTEHPMRLDLSISDGVVLVGGDSHYQPGEVTTAHRAFVKFIKEMKPKAIVDTGDSLDGAQISRHSRIGWDNPPTVIDEIEATKERKHEIEMAAGRARKIWIIGNHDERFETRLSNVAPEYAMIHGTRIRDHFPLWETCWTCWINPDIMHGPVIQHRWKGGMHAPFNNAKEAGRSMISGDHHSAKVYPITDYNGTRYGMDVGCIADIHSDAFNYMRGKPSNWRSAFGVLTFVSHQLLMPELVLVWNEDHVQWRGQLIRV